MHPFVRALLGLRAEEKDTDDLEDTVDDYDLDKALRDHSGRIADSLAYHLGEGGLIVLGGTTWSTLSVQVPSSSASAT